MLRNRGRTPLAPAAGEYQHKTRRAASSTRPIKPRQPPRRHQRGIGAVEYLVGTGVLLTVLLAPFGASNQNVIQRLIHAVQRQQAAYEYVAGLPSLPRGPGALSGLPVGNPVGGGAGSKGASGSDPFSTGSGMGNTTDPTGDGDPVDGSSGSASVPVDFPDTGTGGGPGPTDGGSGAGSGGGGPDPGGNLSAYPDGSNQDENNSDDADDSGGGSGLGWLAKLGIGVGVAEVACLATPEQNPKWTAMDIAAFHAAADAYSMNGKGFAKQGIPYGGDNKYSLPSGFAADLTRAPNGRWIVAFRGTNPIDYADWKDNVEQALLGQSAQYQYAIELAQRVGDELGNNVLYVGHSLGGGMADAAAYATGGDAITFNAAGLNAHYRPDPPGPGTLRNHYIVGGILNTLQKSTPLPKAPGTQIAHSASCLEGPFQRHLKSNFHPPAQPGPERPGEPFTASAASVSNDSAPEPTLDDSSQLQMYVPPDKLNRSTVKPDPLAARR